MKALLRVFVLYEGKTRRWPVDLNNVLADNGERLNGFTAQFASVAPSMIMAASIAPDFRCGKFKNQTGISNLVCHSFGKRRGVHLVGHGLVSGSVLCADRFVGPARHRRESYA